jgi:hypothetical protein
VPNVIGRKVPCRVAATAFLALCCMLASSSYALAASSIPTPPLNLASSDWSVKASPNLVTKPPPASVVDTFIKTQENLAIGYADVLLRVCSFHFADLRHDGSLSLVAGTDSSGRGLCRQVDVLDKKASGFQIFEITGSIGAGADASDTIKDIRRNGNLQLVIDEDFTMDQGVAQCAASWPVIYAWTGRDYTNVSAQFREFYQQKLASLVAEIPKLPSGGPGSNPGDQGYEEQARRECLAAETAKIQRFLGVSRDSGLNEAIEWAKESNSAKRIFAAEILADIDTPEARKYLEALTKDSDQRVGFLARRWLSRGPSTPAEKFAPPQ